MRQLLTIALILAFAGSALAVDTGSVQPLADKGTSHVLMNQSSDREGGEDMGTAVVIDALPFMDTGATCDNLDDWDEACPYTNSTSPDVWYAFTPGMDMSVSIDLLGSTYDTKTYVLDGDYNVIACNDDFYSDYVSFIEDAPLTGGVTYYIVVDGYFGDCGDYVLNVIEFIPPPPCIVECAGVAEGEPENGPDYVDFFNGGCNTDPAAPFDYLTELVADEYGMLTFCGVGGWTGTGKDTDWFVGTIGSTGTVVVDMEFEVAGWFFELSGLENCDTVNIEQEVDPLPCEVISMTITGTPGSPVYLWAGAQDYAPPVGFDGYNFNYRLDITGLQEGPVATDSATWDAVKTLYR